LFVFSQTNDVSPVQLIFLRGISNQSNFTALALQLRIPQIISIGIGFANLSTRSGSLFFWLARD
jgi:hypothetical protein